MGILEESIVLGMVVWAAALLLAMSANPLMLHASGVSDAVQRTSTVELGESAEAAINAEEASLNKQTSLTEDELLRSTKAWGPRITAELVQPKATPWEVLRKGPRERSPLKWLALVKEAARSAAKRDAERRDDDVLSLLQESDEPIQYQQDKAQAKQALTAAQDALTKAALKEVHLDAQLADLSAAIQSKQGDQAELDREWQDAKKQKAQAEAEFNSKEDALQDAFAEVQKYEQQQAHALARQEQIQQSKSKLEQAQKHAASVTSQLETDNEALATSREAAKQAAQRMEEAGLSASWLRATGEADVATGQAAHDAALQDRGVVEQQEAADVEAGRQPTAPLDSNSSPEDKQQPIFG